MALVNPSNIGHIPNICAAFKLGKGSEISRSSEYSFIQLFS
jgi:hypothetical protein